MVIVVLGIIASIGADILSSVYNSYISSRKIDRQYTKINVAMEQITKRLQNAVFESIIARKSETNSTFKPVATILTKEKNQIYEWIAKDIESFNGEANATVFKLGWSGFVDLYSPETNATQIKTPGSNLSYVNKVIKALSYGTADINDSAIIFKGAYGYTEDGYGWNYSDFNHTKIFPVKYKSEDVLEFNSTSNFSNVRINEKYILTWTAYGLVLSDDGNLTLYYNYRPWKGEKYSDGNSSLILEDVKSVNFLQVDKALRVQICTGDPVDEASIKPFCVERGVM
jgi:hypothetical protein